MSTDFTCILISAGGGIIIGILLGFAIMGAMATRAATRAEREAWKAADRYYKRKSAQP